MNIWRTNGKPSIEECDYFPLNLNDIIDNDLFHCSLKGCDIEMIDYVVDKDFHSVNKFCHTHGVNCSKSGWKIGFYDGLETAILPERRPHKDETFNDFLPKRKKTFDRVLKYKKVSSKIFKNV